MTAAVEVDSVQHEGRLVREPSEHVDWIHALLGTLQYGSAGVVIFVKGYEPYLPSVGTSPSVVDCRWRAAFAAMEHVVSSLRPVNDVTALPVADQLAEIQASLSLNRSQLAEVLRVTRPTLYGWFGGTAPRQENAERIEQVLRLLVGAGVSGENPLNARFVRRGFEGESSILEVLREAAIDESLARRRIERAKALGDEVRGRIRSREQRLETLGYEGPTNDRKKQMLGDLVAQLDWPKGK